MKQAEIYKEALRIMEQAKVTTTWLGRVSWKFETHHFWALCPLIRDIISEDIRVFSRFKRDSEKVLGNKLNDSKYWFTDIKEDELKARQERINHLENLIKLYEDEKTIKKY